MKTEIVFENENLIVIYKPAGLASQSSKIGEKDVVSELKNYLKGGYVGLIHRLDQPVEGLLVFAKNKDCAADLSRQVAGKTGESGSGFVKEYEAVVLGVPEAKNGKLENYVIKKDNLAEIVPDTVKDAKKAVLYYETVKIIDTDAGKISLLKIRLETGRFHQIRVQMAGAGLPLLGDRKYGNKESLTASECLGVRNAALCAERLVFENPAKSKNKKSEPMEFSHEPESEIFKLF